MSLRSRLSSALGALLGEPVPSHDLAKALDEQRALTEYERMTRSRYSLHLDDIRCDLADAGIAIPEDDDPETTPRRMVRALIGARAESPPAKPAPAVPEARVLAILRAVDALAEPLSAFGIVATSANDPALKALSYASIARIVSSVAREGWLADDGKKPRRYTLTAKGRAALADSARVAS
jgi:hypothetical protein